MNADFKSVDLVVLQRNDQLLRRSLGQLQRVSLSRGGEHWVEKPSVALPGNDFIESLKVVVSADRFPWFQS